MSEYSDTCQILPKWCTMGICPTGFLTLDTVRGAYMQQLQIRSDHHTPSTFTQPKGIRILEQGSPWLKFLEFEPAWLFASAKFLAQPYDPPFARPKYIPNCTLLTHSSSKFWPLPAHSWIFLLKDILAFCVTWPLHLVAPEFQNTYKVLDSTKLGWWRSECCCQNVGI